MTPRCRVWPWVVVLGSGCARATGEGGSGSEIRAEFGVFYGGQVQERQELPLVFDRALQQQGFRLQRDAATAEPLRIRWELGKPGTGRRVKGSRGLEMPRRVQSGQAEWLAGKAVFEQVLPFLPADPVGLWNIRVLAGERVLIDHPFLVFDAARRKREQRDAG